MKAQYLTHIREVAADQWNALAAGHPFLSHEFFCALEDSGCVSPGSGWTPQHLAMFDAHGLAAAAPLYRKMHSWGEFVFDFAWGTRVRAARPGLFPETAVRDPVHACYGTEADVPPGPAGASAARGAAERDA